MPLPYHGLFTTTFHATIPRVDHDTNSNTHVRVARRIVPTAVAVSCLALGALVSTDSWARWFHHPAREPLPETTLTGAALLRTMLLVAAGVWVLIPWLLTRFAGAASRVDQPSAHIDEQSEAPAFGRGRVLALLVIIVLIGLVIRMTRITESLWYDEIAAFKQYAQFTPGVIVGNYFDPVNHIAHTLLTWLSVTAFGDHALALRLPALVFSLASIPIVFALVRECCSPRAALIAAALTAVLPVSVLQGLEARGYSMMICLAAASTWLWILACHRGRCSIWIAYALVTALGIWAHPLTAFVPIGHGLWLVWTAGRVRHWMLLISGGLALILAAVTTLTLYAPVLPDMLAARSMFARTGAEQPSVFGPEGMHALLQLGGSWSGWAAVPGLISFTIGFIHCVKDHRGRTIVALTMLGGALLFAMFVLAGTWMYARFALFVVPGAIVMMTIGITFVWRRSSALATLLAGLIAVAAAGDLMMRPPKQPLREAMQVVHERSAPNTRVVVVGLAHRVADVYAGDLDLRYSLFHGRDLNAAITQHEPAWIVLYYPQSVDDRVYQTISESGFNNVARFNGWVDWSNGDVLVYQRARAQTTK